MHTTLLTSGEAAEWLRTSKGYLAKLRCTGDGPDFVKISTKVLYREEDLENFVNRRIFQNTIYPQGVNDNSETDIDFEEANQ